LADRETIEETQRFLQAVLTENEKHRRSCLLVRVFSSRPVFHVEQHGLIDYFKELARRSVNRIALLADTAELRISHDYLEFLALRQRLNVRSFADEAAALEWLQQERRLQQRRAPHERRQRAERQHAMERRRPGSRRNGQRRSFSPGAELRR
jgi:hypothetical protein